MTVRVVSAPPSSSSSASCTISSSVIGRTVAVGELDLGVGPHGEQIVTRLGSARGDGFERLGRELEHGVDRRVAPLMCRAVGGVLAAPYIVTSDHSRHFGHRSGRTRASRR